jgi:hypothetical protein
MQETLFQAIPKHEPFKPFSAGTFITSRRQSVKGLKGQAWVFAAHWQVSSQSNLGNGGDSCYDPRHAVTMMMSA